MIQKPSTRKKARRYAVQGIYQWHLSGNDINEIELQFLETINQNKVDIEYFRDILTNTLINVTEIDEILTPYFDREFDEVNPVELAILRLASYELKSRMDIPYKVVINEALELTKTFGATDGHKFVNGILDKLAKQLRPLEVKAKANRP
ncbi:transcription antitermination factor NusB [Aliikangiella coralliicola]|uniref:Transcription antitermination protein NusB n=1 Tax=Aliikangiella coralliicola TaxID=2592383 RepID=A0A545U776_9GAMM|nr:transcription antitermination factor NusB [Aliikangiella coralliicola]TQV85294.1 transcription antitermination factor NusB [Aliikangiella coralliicola]